MSEKDLLDKLDGMNDLTKSQFDRLQKSLVIQDSLMGFLENQISKVINENSLKATLLNNINDRMEEEGFNEVPWAVVLKLLEIYSKEENEIAITLLNMMKDIQVKNSENNTMQEIMDMLSSNKKGDQDFTKEEMNEFKNMYNFMKNIKDSEFSEKK